MCSFLFYFFCGSFLEVIADGKTLCVIDENQAVVRKSSVLFEETYYTHDDTPYTVFCIDKPLSGCKFH